MINPAAKIVPEWRDRRRRNGLLVVMAERHQLEIFAPEEIGVGDQEDHESRSRRRGQAAAQMR